MNPRFITQYVTLLHQTSTFCSIKYREQEHIADCYENCKDPGNVFSEFPGTKASLNFKYYY